MPIYTQDPTSVQFKAVGESIQLKLTASISTVNITWSRYYQLPGGVTDTAPITANHSVSERKDSSGISSVLTFPRLQLPDGGYYQARATYRSMVNTEFYNFQVFGEKCLLPLLLTLKASGRKGGEGVERTPPPLDFFDLKSQRLYQFPKALAQLFLDNEYMF